jgi:alpha-methylacyl-CoA racemase
MLDGANAQMAMFHGFRAAGLFDGQTGTHFLGGAAHFYATYETRDGRYLAVAALEPALYRDLIHRAGLDAERFGPHGLGNPPVANGAWPELKAELAAVFRTKTRDEWCALLEGTDACVAPVLTIGEASGHPHNVARRAFINVDGVLQNAPAPRFSATPAGEPRPPVGAGADTRTVLAQAGFSAAEIDQLVLSGAAVQSG